MRHFTETMVELATDRGLTPLEPPEFSDIAEAYIGLSQREHMAYQLAVDAAVFQDIPVREAAKAMGIPTATMGRILKARREDIQAIFDAELIDNVDKK